MRSVLQVTVAALAAFGSTYCYQKSRIATQRWASSSDDVVMDVTPEESVQTAKQAQGVTRNAVESPDGPEPVAFLICLSSPFAPATLWEGGGHIIEGC